jgi:glycosyltransferase involved in cell wall biosynthesis
MALRYLLLDQMRAVREAGHIVTAVSAPGPWVEQVRAAGIPVHTVPFTRRMAPFTDIRAAAALAWHLARTRPQLVHTHTPKASLVGQWVARAAHIQHRVHTIFGLYFPAEMRPKDRWFYALLERLQMAPAQLVFSQNAEDVATCIRDRICDPAKMRLLGNGIDITAFSPKNGSPERRAAIRAALSIPAGHRVVGAVARLVAEKGYRELFAAAHDVLARHPDTTFIVVGGVDEQKGDRIDTNTEAVRSLGASLRLLGHRDNVADLYGAMDLFVHPSHREGFPRSPMEAAASGLPVITTDVRGCRETVIHGETGLLVPPKDAAALASAISTLLADGAARDRMGRAGRTLAERHFDQRDVFRKVLAGYAELAGP